MILLISYPLFESISEIEFDILSRYKSGVELV